MGDITRKEDFGVIIACCIHDYMLAQGTCASVRYFLGDVPIAVIVDGLVPTRVFRQTFGASIIKREDITEPFLREKSFGWGYTKMNVFWVSPWENFLYLDADTVVWGDIAKYADFASYDFIADMPRCELSDTAVAKFVFDHNKLTKLYPNFPWRKYKSNYFCSGVFFGKRDTFNVAEYKDILSLVESDPKLFFPGEQGFLNFMVFRAHHEGKIRVNQEPFQVLAADFSRDEVAQRFQVHKRKPYSVNENVVIHWAGEKPTIFAKNVYSAPMNLFRELALNEEGSKASFKSRLIIGGQDFLHLLCRFKYRVRLKTQRMLGVSQR